MSKVKIILVVICMAISLTGCDKKKDKNVEVYSETHYFNVTEKINVATYNGYRLTGFDRVDNDDGSIDVLLKINKIIK